MKRLFLTEAHTEFALKALRTRTSKRRIQERDEHPQSKFEKKKPIGNVTPLLQKLIELWKVVCDSDSVSDWHLCPLCPYTESYRSNQEQFEHIISCHMTPCDSLNEVLSLSEEYKSEKIISLWSKGQKVLESMAEKKFSPKSQDDLKRLEIWIDKVEKNHHICHFCEWF